MAAQIIFSILTFSFLIPCLAGNQTTFDILNVNCYEFRLDQNAESRSDAPITKQTWCYHQARKNGDPLFVFNIDTGKVAAETSFILDDEGFLTHGSLHAGVVSIHKVKATAFNPFPVPLTEPENLKPVTGPQISASSAQDVLNNLVKSKPHTAANFKLMAGQISAFETANILPWRGYWWSYKFQPLSRTDTSPLAKYDRYVVAHTNQPSNARDWENSNHRYKGIWWEGHCNGWAASSILRPEPRFSKIDPMTKTVFSVPDQNGILVETDYCSLDTFYGSRNRGRSTDDKFDIHADLFHKTILYFIGNLKKPVVMDYRPDAAVDNHPVSGYTMDIKQIDETHFEVVAVLNFHKYDGKINLPPGLAPMYTRTYKYTLQKNAEGDIIGGNWLSTNPDFIWVPMGIKDCDSNNPYMKLDQVQEILNLPPAPGQPLVLFD